MEARAALDPAENLQHMVDELGVAVGSLGTATKADENRYPRSAPQGKIEVPDYALADVFDRLDG